jgi:hypothetical protein
VLTATQIALINWALKGIEWVAKKRPFKILKSAPSETETVDRLKHREALRNEFYERLPKPDHYGVRGEAIIHDIKRINSYPRLDNRRKGTFPWVIVEVRGTYPSGLEVIIGVPREIKKDMYGEWKFVDYSDEDTLLVYQVGRIPYDVIKHINWEGDEYCRCPHIYCQFDAAKQHPYEHIAYFAKFPDSEELYEVTDFRPS